MDCDVDPDKDRSQGFREGQTDARLQGHDEHFKMINGSLVDINKRLGELPWTIVVRITGVIGLAAALAKVYSIIFP